MGRSGRLLSPLRFGVIGKGAALPRHRPKGAVSWLGFPSPPVVVAAPLPVPPTLRSVIRCPSLQRCPLPLDPLGAKAPRGER